MTMVMPPAMQPLRLIIPPTLKEPGMGEILTQVSNYEPVVEGKGAVDCVILAHPNHDGQSSTKKVIIIEGSDPHDYGLEYLARM